MSEESRNAGKELRDSEITEQIIAAAIAVHRERGPGEHRLDFVVEGKIIVELKAVEALEKVHFAIVRSYLKAAGLSDGLILNFSSIPLTIKRVRRGRSFEKIDLHVVKISCVPAFLRYA